MPVPAVAKPPPPSIERPVPVPAVAKPPPLSIEPPVPGPAMLVALPAMPPLLPLQTLPPLLDFRGHVREPGCDYFGRPLPQPTPTPTPVPAPAKPPPPSINPPAPTPTADNFAAEDASLAAVRAAGTACPWCGKLCSDGHVASALHAQRRLEAAMLTRLAGARHPSWGPRVLTGTKAYVPRPGFPVCQSTLKAHWGMRIESMPDVGMDIIRRQGGVKQKKHQVMPKGASLAILNYSGAGKYNERTCLIPWKALPRTPGDVGGSSTDPRPVLARHEAAILGDPQYSWWPVLILHAEYDHFEGILLEVANGVLWVICIYQLMEGTLVSWQTTAYPLDPRQPF